MTKNQRPRCLETSSLLTTESATYPSLLESLFHLPCRFQHLSFTSELAASVAPPERNECNPRLSSGETSFNVTLDLALARLLSTF